MRHKHRDAFARELAEVPVFAADFDRHEQHGACAHAHRPAVLPLPDPATRDWSFR